MLKRLKLLTVFGFFVIIIPLIGVSSFTKAILSFFVGFCIVGISLVLRRDSKKVLLKNKHLEDQKKAQGEVVEGSYHQ